MSDLIAKDVDGNEISVGDSVFMVSTYYVGHTTPVPDFTIGRCYKVLAVASDTNNIVVEDDDGFERTIVAEFFCLNDHRVRDFSGKHIEQPQKQQEEQQVPFQEESESMEQQLEEKKYLYVDEWKDCVVVTERELLEDIKKGEVELNSEIELYELGSKVEMNLSLNIKPLKD